MHKTLALWRADHLNFEKLLQLLDVQLERSRLYGFLCRVSLVQNGSYVRQRFPEEPEHQQNDGGMKNQLQRRIAR